MSKTPSYGSVSDAATETSYFTAKACTGPGDEAVGQSFDADHTYYLKSGSSLSFKQKLRKYGVAAVPIFMAALIVGFFTLYLLRNLSNLYPARGDEHAIKGEPGHTTSVSAIDYHGPVKTPDSLHRPQMDDNEKRPTSEKSDGGSSACSTHPNCAHLIGNCCPAANGLMLDCCN